MKNAAPADGYPARVWSAVGQLWPNLGKDPARVVGPYIPVLPAFLSEAQAAGRTPESAALEVLTYFLRIYIENTLTAEERNAQLVDLHALSKRSFEDSQKVNVLPFTAALFGAQQTLSEWASAGKVPADAGRSLNGDVLRALIGKPPVEISRIGWLTLEASRKR
jgi:hypothetical protein